MRFPCTMVVRNAERYAMESGSLKFGMDRILSEEISPSPNGNRSEEAWSSSPPCVGCISSVYRCCRSFTSSAATPFLDVGVRAPRPLGPCAPESDVPAEPPPASSSGAASKRKRSWSRAVFSNLQRKGLEKRFQLQKYITKPDRRQLAATLGLTDAQVKVWFQNRRMKWRHTKESFRPNPGAAAAAEAPENISASADSTRGHDSDSECGSDVDVQTVDI